MPPLQTCIGFGGAASGRPGEFERAIEFVCEAERLGVNYAWSAEAWGQDAIAPLAFLAARTDRIKLGTGIMQISARVPAMTAMTAMTMASISNGRFVLGLGASGPQVVEGLQGVPFARPLERMREVIEIVRMLMRGEKLVYEGNQFVIPRPGGEGKALRLAQPANPDIPIYLATLGEKGLDLTGELADGWLGTSFIPESAGAMLGPIRKGAERAGRTLADLDLQVGGVVGFGDDLEALIRPLKPGLAFTLGAMGSPKTNFYNDAYKRAGYRDAATEVQKLWVEGRREEAAERVPDDLVVAANLLGTEEMVRDRIRAYRRSGINTLRLSPMGKTPAEQLDTLGRALDLVRSVGAEKETP